MNKFRKRMALLATVAMLGGCASTEQRRAEFSAATDAWVGKPLDELVQAKGPPTASFTLTDGKRVIEYLRKETVVSGGEPMTMMSPVFVPNGGGWVYVPQPLYFPSRSMTLACKLLFTVSKDNLIESWKAEGNDCY